MKYKYFFLLFFLFSCSSGSTQNKKSSFIPYSAKGFALIYKEIDYDNKTISKKLNENEMQIGHDILKKNSIIILTNPENNKSIELKVSKKVNYPDFFKVLITDKVSKKLELNKNFPFVDIQERIKNKSFVAKKAVTFSEEKKVLTKIPVATVKIDNISKQKNKSTNHEKYKKFYIDIGIFYSINSANELIIFLNSYNIKKEDLRVKKIKENQYQLIAGPYSSINALKNDYFKLNKYGFYNLDIIQND